MSYIPSSWSGPSSPPPPPPRQPFMSKERIIVLGVFIVLIGLSVRTGQINFPYLLLSLLVLVPAIVLHEVSHGWLAHKFGDMTAKNAGRLSLNPARHIDPFGTTILPLALALFGAPLLGYAKPVPVNTTRMSRNKAMFTALVGPFVNVLLAIVAIGIIVFGINVMGANVNALLVDPRLIEFADFGRFGAGEWVIMLGFMFGLVNITLAVFNMIPIPPLDGSSIIERFLPAKYMNGYLKFRQYSFILLLLIFLLGSRFLGGIISPFQQAWVDLLALFLPI